MCDTRTLILASASPRRKEILKGIGLRFKVDESNYKEENAPRLKPHDLARFLSREKAVDVAQRHGNAIVIAADTLVVLGCSLFGKPADKEDARRMLKTLSGRAHSVITGFTVIDTAINKEISGLVETKVFFKSLNADEIDAYIRSGEPMDKAGAYGIQGLGALLVKKIEGDFFNVVGLPLNALADCLSKLGVKILG